VICIFDFLSCVCTASIPLLKRLGIGDTELPL
jgi:hypothetical protein